jgi:DNA-binding LacI/PurR family transcriptional regulator
MATIADVAAHAGVGLGTVSRVLNGSPKVSDSTRAKVLASIEALHYRPNPQAQALSRSRRTPRG